MQTNETTTMTACSPDIQILNIIYFSVKMKWQFTL